MMGSDDVDRPLVLIYRSSLLPYSETFILKQAQAMRMWKPVLVGEGSVSNGLAVSGVDSLHLSFGGGFLRKLLRVLHIVFRFRPFSLNKIRRISPDLIHVHFGTDAVDIWPIVKRLNVPLLVTLHGYDIQIDKKWWESGKGGFLRKGYPQQLLAMSRNDHVSFLAVSTAIKRRAIEFGIPENKVRVSHIGIDTNQFSVSPFPMSERRDVLFVGRLVDKKGCQYLLEAFSSLQEKYQNSRLVIVGDGPLKGRLQDFSNEHGVRADFLGALSGDLVAQKMQQARVFCLPSIRANNGDAEGFGLVILEAQSSGTPVITSAEGGKEEGIINGETGFSHDPASVSQLTEFLDRLLGDDDLATRFSTNAVKNVRENLELSVCTKALEDIYSETVK